MALTELFVADQAATVVSSGGTTAPASGTSETWTVASSTGFGTAVTGVSQFHVSDPALPSEVIAVTNVSGTTWTVTRGAEGTATTAHSAGFTAQQVIGYGFLTSPVFGGAVSTAGLTGATAASRYAGATASGAPVSGTFAAGDFVIDQSAAIWICTSPGSPGTWATPNPGTISGQFLSVNVYAPSSTTLTVNSTTALAAFSSANVNTGSFTAPASGAVIVEASFTGSGPTTVGYVFGLAAHGTVSPVVGNLIIFRDSTSGISRPYTLRFYVNGLTAGTSYNFDLVGGMTVSGTFTMSVAAQTASSPATLANGSPVVMTVQAV